MSPVSLSRRLPCPPQFVTQWGLPILAPEIKMSIAKHYFAFMCSVGCEKHFSVSKHLWSHLDQKSRDLFLDFASFKLLKMVNKRWVRIYRQFRLISQHDFFQIETKLLNKNCSWSLKRPQNSINSQIKCFKKSIMAKDRNSFRYWQFFDYYHL